MMSRTRAEKVSLVMALDERLRRKRRALTDKAREDFYTFFRWFAWPVLEPSTPYVDNWHVHAICEHLQAVSKGQVNRLIINMPFRMLKSTLVSQAWPVWEWVEKPSLQYLTSSYAKVLSIRDAVNSRRIIESDGFQESFGDRFMMTSDQNVKSFYENSKRGQRVATSTDAAATGFGGNRILVDDPISSKDADSEVARLTSIEWWKGTAATRFNDASKDAAVVVMQRLHEDDLTGYLLKSGARWEHLVLPMRYERKRMVYIEGNLKEVETDTISTATGFVDPRSEEGELLCPARLNDAAVSAIELDLGTYHTKAQLQQAPTTRGGTIFVRDHWNFWKALPSFDEVVISVDAAFKDTKTSDFVAIQLWGRKQADKYLIKRTKERMGFGATVKAIEAMREAAIADKYKLSAILIEDKANGPAIIETLKKTVAGVIAIEPEGGKVARAFAIQPEHEAGNIYVPDPSIDPKIEEFLSETASFPNVAHDDETDAFTQAINWLRNRVTKIGMLEYYRQEQARMNAEKEKANG